MTDTPDPVGELERYGLDWQGHDRAITRPMPNGYWTPWHEAQEALSSLQGQVRELHQRHYQIMLEICGGEDAPGFASSLGVEDVKRMMASDRAREDEATDTIARLSEEIEALRHDLNGYVTVSSDLATENATLRDALERSNTTFEGLLADDYLSDSERAALAVRFNENRLTLTPDPDIGTPEKEENDG